MVREYFDKLYDKDKESITTTEKLITFIKDSIWTSDSYERTKIASTLIITKATRRQTKIIEKQTDAINKNSNSSDKLTKIWHYLTWAIIFQWIVQIIITIIN